MKNSANTQATNSETKVKHLNKTITNAVQDKESILWLDAAMLEMYSKIYYDNNDEIKEITELLNKLSIPFYTGESNRKFLQINI